MSNYDFFKIEALKKVEKSPEDKKVAPAQLEEKSTTIKNKIKKYEHESKLDSQLIDQKINEILNKRLLKLVKIGLKHELTIDNMIQYFKENRKLKLYNLIRYFSDAKPNEVEEMLKYLNKKGSLYRDRSGWYSLK